MTPGETCATCSNYDPSPEVQLRADTDATGKCRARPPHSQYGWPLVTEDDWCGNWRRPVTPTPKPGEPALDLLERPRRRIPPPPRPNTPNIRRS